MAHGEACLLFRVDGEFVNQLMYFLAPSIIRHSNSEHLHADAFDPHNLEFILHPNSGY